MIIDVLTVEIGNTEGGNVLLRSRAARRKRNGLASKFTGIRNEPPETQ